MTIVELYLYDRDKSIKDHFQRLVEYNEKVLESQPLRHYIVSAISSIRYIRFVKSTRTNGTLTHSFTASLELKSAHHLEYFIEMLINDEVNGYIADSFTWIQEGDTSGRKLPIKMNTFLGVGGTSRVFGISDNEDVVCKVVINETFYTSELNTLRNLARSKDGCFIRLIGSSRRDQALILSPKGEEEINPTATRRVEILEQQFACLQELRKAKIVHRDVVSHHFLRRVNNHQASTASASDQPANRSDIFLIDFGFAMNVGDFCYFAGSDIFASTELISHLVAGAQYTAQCWHDWVSLINCLSMDLHGGICDLRRRLYKFRPSTTADYSQLVKFWNAYYANFRCCGRFIEMCTSTRNMNDNQASEQFNRISEEFQEHFQQEINKNVITMDRILPNFD